MKKRKRIKKRVYEKVPLIPKGLSEVEREIYTREVLVKRIVIE